MDLRVVESGNELHDNFIVVDSADIGENTAGHRIDHHLDDGWSSLDSIYASDLDHIQTVDSPTIACSYIDPDAVIAAAVLRYLFEEPDHSQHLRDSEIGKILYSATFWCDYHAPCSFFSHRINEYGNALELWLRTKLKDVTSQKSDVSTEDRSEAFQFFSDTVLKTIHQRTLPPAISSFNAEEYLAAERENMEQFVDHTQSTESIGVIRTQGYKGYVIPRAYYPLFDQPIVIRLIPQAGERAGHDQVVIGVNPHCHGWQGLNLEKLAGIIEDRKGWQFDGRRVIIATLLKEEAVSELIELLDTISLDSLIDTCPLWSIYG